VHDGTSLYTFSIINKFVEYFVFSESYEDIQKYKIVAFILKNLETTRLRGRPRNRWQDEVREDGRIVGGEE
jgi:hypothetical protein